MTECTEHVTGQPKNGHLHQIRPDLPFKITDQEKRITDQKVYMSGLLKATDPLPNVIWPYSQSRSVKALNLRLFFRWNFKPHLFHSFFTVLSGQVLKFVYLFAHPVKKCQRVNKEQESFTTLSIIKRE